MQTYCKVVGVVHCKNYYPGHLYSSRDQGLNRNTNPDYHSMIRPRIPFVSTGHTHIVRNGSLEICRHNRTLHPCFLRSNTGLCALSPRVIKPRATVSEPGTASSTTAVFAAFLENTTLGAFAGANGSKRVCIRRSNRRRFW